MKRDLSFEEITKRIKATEFPECDAVVGIASGGTVPASLIAFQIEKPLYTFGLNLRDEANDPKYDEPKILWQNELPKSINRIILIDDVSVSGKTLDKAKSLIHNCEITTLVFKGKADIVLFPEINTCVNWPWKPND